jgi:peptidoglycan hydrolase-like protein with peptidoglycan-binding domain
MRRLALFFSAALLLATVLAVPGPASAAGCNTVASGFSWTNNCQQAQGDSNNMVTAIQRLVTGWGCSPGTIDGIFGVATYDAVVCMQGKDNLQQDGVVGPKTWAAFFSQHYGCSPDGHWSYFGFVGTTCIFRQWDLTGIWYVKGLNGTFVRMDTSGPS